MRGETLINMFVSVIIPHNRRVNIPDSLMTLEVLRQRMAEAATYAALWPSTIRPKSLRIIHASKGSNESATQPTQPGRRNS
jgi:hypothetical protein